MLGTITVRQALQIPQWCDGPQEQSPQGVYVTSDTGL